MRKNPSGDLCFFSKCVRPSVILSYRRHFYWSDRAAGLGFFRLIRVYFFFGLLFPSEKEKEKEMEKGKEEDAEE